MCVNLQRHSIADTAPTSKEPHGCIENHAGQHHHPPTIKNTITSAKVSISTHVAVTDTPCKDCHAAAHKEEEARSVPYKKCVCVCV